MDKFYKIQLTYNKDAEKIWDKIEKLNKYSWITYCVAAKETGMITGKTHVHIFIYCQTQQRVSRAVKIFKGKPHIEICYGTVEQNRDYLRKQGTDRDTYYEPHEWVPKEKKKKMNFAEIIKIFCDGAKKGLTPQEVYKDNDTLKGAYAYHYQKIDRMIEKDKQTEIEDQFKESWASWQPKLWQQEILDIVKETPDFRKIYWYYGPPNIGKSQISFYIEDTMDALRVEKTDYVNMAKLWTGQKIVIFDLPLAYKDVDYTLLESVKSGRIMSTKYEPIRKKFIRPHLIVFANFKPDTSMLSEDRWIITCLDQSYMELDN